MRQLLVKLKIKQFGLDEDQKIPDTTGWTGREIESLCDKADRRDTSLVESAQYVVPITVSQAGTIDELRRSADNRYLSANAGGMYRYKVPETVHERVVENTGRKLR